VVLLAHPWYTDRCTPAVHCSCRTPSVHCGYPPYTVATRRTPTSTVRPPTATRPYTDRTTTDRRQSVHRWTTDEQTSIRTPLDYRRADSLRTPLFLGLPERTPTADAAVHQRTAATPYTNEDCCPSYVTWPSGQFNRIWPKHNGQSRRGTPTVVHRRGTPTMAYTVRLIIELYGLTRLMTGTPARCGITVQYFTDRTPIVQHGAVRTV